MSTQSLASFILDAKAVQNIIAKRRIIRLTDADSVLKFEVQGNGNTIAVVDKSGAPVLSNNGTGVPLTKTIYNIKANSHVAMLNPRNREILREAMTAETAGDVDTAHAKFNEYLNKIQVSFSVIINPGRTHTQFFNGQMVQGRVQLITTDNGQLLTLENVVAVRIEEAAKTPTFSLADLMGLDDKAPDAQTVFTPLEGATGKVDA
jgi:hypothetical protein